MKGGVCKVKCFFEPAMFRAVPDTKGTALFFYLEMVKSSMMRPSRALANRRMPRLLIATFV